MSNQPKKLISYLTDNDIVLQLRTLKAVLDICIFFWEESVRAKSAGR